MLFRSHSNMSGKTQTFETGHEEMIHDSQLDYYGKRLATASSDRTIKVRCFTVGFAKILSWASARCSKLAATNNRRLRTSRGKQRALRGQLITRCGAAQRARWAGLASVVGAPEVRQPARLVLL